MQYSCPLHLSFHVDTTTLPKLLRHRPALDRMVAAFGNAISDDGIHSLLILNPVALRLNKFQRLHDCNVLSVQDECGLALL